MTKYIDHKTLRNAVKVPTKNNDGIVFAIIAAVFVLTSAVVWFHDLDIFWRMPT